MSSRRDLLKGAALTPLALLVQAPVARATDYASAADALDAADRLEGDVAARLRGISQAVPGALRFARSVLADHERHRARRAWVRRRLKLALSAPAADTVSQEVGLDGLRSAQQDLVYAYAEGLPALQDALAVDAMARNLVDLSRHLAVIDLWISS